MRPRASSTRHLALALMATACAGPATWPAEPSCDTPRSAADSMLVWQQERSFDLDRAITCVDAPRDEAPRLASQLKAVLDARGLYVPVKRLPDAADFENEHGEAIVQVFPDLPLILARGEDGAWRYDRTTMGEVPRLYRETFSPLVTHLQEALPPAFFGRVGPLYLWQLLFAVGLVALALLIGAVARYVVYDRVIRLAKARDLQIDPASYRGVDTPLMLVATFGTLAWGLPQLQLPIQISRFVVSGCDVALRLAGVWLALRLIDAIAELARSWASQTASKLDDQLVPLLRSTANAVAITLGVLLLAGLIVDVWKLIAGASVGGLIVGLAAQDTVKNFFGSLNVFIDRPFQIEDWVVLNGVEGVVEEVGFRSTRIRTFYNSQVSIPNGEITNAHVDNMGRRPRRRVKLTVGVTYDTPPDRLQAFVQGIRAILAAHPSVQNTYEVHFNGLGASSLDILVYYHLVVPDWHAELEARAQNLLEILRLARALDVSFAFPSTSVYVEATPERPLPDRPEGLIEELSKVVEAFGPGGTLSRPEGPGFPRSFHAAEVTQRGS